MRSLLLILFIMMAQVVLAQLPIAEETKQLEKAMLEKDTVTLHQLLHPDLIYGHSNGWVETKTELLQNLASGKMHYSSIFSEEPEFKRTGDVISVRTKSRIAFVVNEKAGELDLFVVQVWKKEIDGWKLLVRQSTRLN
jgi:hypothetical protein